MSVASGIPTARDDIDGTAATTPTWLDDPGARTSLDTLLDGIVMYSAVRDDHGEIADFVCDYANAAVTTNRGVPAAAQVGQRMRVLFPGAERAGLFEQFVEVVTSGTPLQIDVDWYEDERVKGAFALHAARLGDGLVIAFRDVTAQRLHERQLNQAAATTAHDLAEPLRVITGFAELLRDTYADRIEVPGVEWLDNILESGNRMRDLINEFLTYARFGEAPPQLASCDVRTVVIGACEALQEQIEQSAATIEIDSNLPTVRADPNGLRRVLQNLIANALKFTRPGVAPHVVIDAVETPSAWDIRVADNGTGVADEDQERIFEPFYRGAAPDGSPGNGLGLTICQRIMEAHGGSIRVEPIEGTGSCFCFSFPVSGVVSPLIGQRWASHMPPTRRNVSDRP